MFKNLFSTRGRIRRKDYWITSIVISIIFAIPLAILVPIMQGGSGATGFLSFIMVIIYLLFLYISIALGIRRCHDLGHSGWWILIPLYVFWLLFQKGQEGENKYGADPKAKANANA